MTPIMPKPGEYLFEDLKAPDSRLILHSKNTGSWLTIWGTTVTSTLLLATEFHDLLFTCYDVIPPEGV